MDSLSELSAPSQQKFHWTCVCNLCWGSYTLFLEYQLASWAQECCDHSCCGGGDSFRVLHKHGNDSCLILLQCVHSSCLMVVIHNISIVTVDFNSQGQVTPYSSTHFWIMCLEPEVHPRVRWHHPIMVGPQHYHCDFSDHLLWIFLITFRKTILRVM